NKANGLAEILGNQDCFSHDLLVEVVEQERIAVDPVERRTPRFEKQLPQRGKVAASDGNNHPLPLPIAHASGSRGTRYRLCTRPLGNERVSKCSSVISRSTALNKGRPAPRISGTVVIVISSIKPAERNPLAVRPP